MNLRWGGGLIAALIATIVAAQAPADSAEQKRRLIEQKIRLVEMLIKSPAARGAAQTGESESTALIEQGQRSLDEARKALTEERFDAATTLLDEALKSASTASRKLSATGGSLSESAQRKSLQDLADQVAMYRTSVTELTRDGQRAAEARDLLERIDALSGESQRLATGGRLGEANKKMAEAYRLAVEELTRLRAGQEVVLSLNFETPADEYAYEKKRYGSNEVMIEMMIGEGRAAGGRQQLVDGFVGEGRKLKAQADERAESGQYAEAVKLMEKASAQLTRALQAMGVPVF